MTETTRNIAETLAEVLPKAHLAAAVDHSVQPAIDRAVRRDHSLCGSEPCSDCR